MHECKDCKLNEGDCGYHFSMNGVIDYTIPSQTACDQFDCCMFFKPKKYETMTNEEAIRRIKDHMRTHKMIEPRAIYITQALELAIEALEEKPQGEWLEVKTNPPDLLGHRFYICSKCGREIDVMTPDETLYDYPYCHCGADMRGDRE